MNAWVLALLAAAPLACDSPARPASPEKAVQLPGFNGKPELYTSKSGQRWRATRTAGAVPESGYEQSYLRLDQLGPAGEVVSTLNFEERAWVRPDAVDRVWVELAYDERGELQAKQQSRAGTKQTTTLFTWNGKAFDRTELK